MRHITVPSPITVSVPFAEGGPPPETITFQRFATLSWLNDDRAIAGGFAKQVRWAKVVDAFQQSETGATISLEDEDYNTLRTIVDAPSARLAPVIAIQLLAYSQAVIDATDKLPTAVVQNGATPEAPAS